MPHTARPLWGRVFSYHQPIGLLSRPIVVGIWWFVKSEAVSWYHQWAPTPVVESALRAPAG